MDVDEFIFWSTAQNRTLRNRTTLGKYQTEIKHSSKLTKLQAINRKSLMEYIVERDKENIFIWYEQDKPLWTETIFREKYLKQRNHN